MKDRDIDIYTAGLMDGEGTITLAHVHNNAYRAPVVSFASTSHELIMFFKENYGGSVVTKKTYAKHHTQSWECRLVYDAALRFLKRIHPYLRHEQKLYRTELLLTEYKQVTARNGRYTPKQMQAKVGFEHRFFHPSTP